MSRFLTRNHLFLAAIVLLAAFFRLYRIDQLPPGFQFDQAFYVFDVIRLLQGQFYIFFAAPGGTEPLYPYLATVGVAIFGDHALGLKLTGAIIGILTIPAMYWFALTIFAPSPASDSERGRVGAWVGLLSALYAAISLWHIFFNRYGERVTLLVLLAIFIFQFFWKANNTLQIRYFGLSGLFTGLALYTYVGSRVLPFALVLFTGFSILSDRKNATNYFRGLVITGLVALVIFAPLGIYFLQNPDQFMSHSAEVSIFVPHGNVTTDVGRAFMNNVLHILGMFFIQGDGGELRNPIPGRPIFDPLFGALFVVGVIAWLVALFSPRSDSHNRRRAVMLATWLTAVLAISLFTDDAPNFVRTLPAMPAVMILAAWGTVEIWNRLRAPSLQYAAIGVFGIAALLNTATNYRDYFITFANDPTTYYTFDTDKVEIANWFNANAQANQVYLAPLLQTNGTISLLTRNSILHSFESRDTIVLPSRDLGKDTLYIFPWEQEKKIQTMADRLGTLGTRDVLKGSNGGTLALIYRIPAANLPNPQSPLSNLSLGGVFVQPQKLESAIWSNNFELLGYSIDTADEAKRNLEVTLFLHALKPMTDDYTFSVKARDPQDRVWGQEDKWLGDNSYATTQWSPGDVIIEKFYPGLNACAPAGDYRISVEAYNPKTLAVLALSDRPGNTALFGSTRAAQSPSNRLEDLEPEQSLEKQISAQLRLMGYTLSSGSLKSGDTFSLSLFWRGASEGSTEPVSIRLQNTVIKESTMQIPVEGRGVCSFFDLTVPSNARPGLASLSVNNFKLTDVEITK